ncbi:MAG: DUF1428 domain-containing protein [Hoeflea sp.]|nr:DUF1428 domain-containing protein [Hoeflea sp.]
MESPGSNTAADQLEAVLVLVRNGKHKSLYVGDVTDLARTAAKVFRNNGALSVVETWGEDVPDGKLTSFPMAVKLEADETVVFSWIVWPDKETCTSGMEASMKQLDEIYGPEQLQNVPFDGKRMIWGGFETIVEA